ncbi:hypothetical protein M5K25_002454 [Dendrobium thyrsiflorum]|uniref:Uncharacterized protein n=1 Tax=Dendrobium thyrsiflorum TaxID=117978 RepID=A0ABD0VNA0_DENTH
MREVDWNSTVEDEEQQPNALVLWVHFNDAKGGRIKDLSRALREEIAKQSRSQDFWRDSRFDNIRESAITASRDSFSESPPRFTCPIYDAMSGSDSSSSGKYRSSSELQSIGNTIMQASRASFLTYFSFIEVLGATEMTRHTSVWRKSASPSSSVPPILSSDIKSASLMGFEELAWLRCCLEVDACTLGNPFRLSTGSLRDLLIFGPHLSPHVGEGSIFIIKEILFNFPFLSSRGAITSAGSGASLVLVLVLPNILQPAPSFSSHN